MKGRRHSFLCILSILLLLTSNTVPLSAKAAKEQVLAPLTTFFNESVSANYTVSGDANTVIPLEIASQGNVTITVDYPSLQNDYMLKIYTDDSYINMIHSSLLSTTNRQHNLNLTAGAAETLYLYITPTTKETCHIKESQNPDGVHQQNTKKQDMDQEAFHRCEKYTLL